MGRTEKTDCRTLILASRRRVPLYVDSGYRWVPWLREQELEAMVLMTPKTLEELGISKREEVTLESTQGPLFLGGCYSSWRSKQFRESRCRAFIALKTLSPFGIITEDIFVIEKPRHMTDL